MPARHGTRARYKAGCKCSSCATTEKKYQQGARQRRKERQAAESAQLTTQVATLTLAPPAQCEPEPGRVEVGVTAELSRLSTVANREGLVEVAIALARVLDNPVAVAQHPSAAHRLCEALDRLRKGSDARQGRLASVRALTRPGKATG